MTDCWRCGQEVDRNVHARYCYACRQITRGIQAAALQAVARAVRRGELPHPKTCTCTDCGAPAFDYDHRSYDEPLKVEPVCRRCNQKRGPAAWRAAA
jgi:hypothetical protein